MNELTVELLQKLCHDDTIVMTPHASDRIRERNIEYDDIKQAIMTGEIIEHYPNDYPYPSCLLLGSAVNGRMLHTVIGCTGVTLWIITAYCPDTEKWEDDFKTRKAVK